jgi:quinol monooxygenase YgiN
LTVVLTASCLLARPGTNAERAELLEYRREGTLHTAMPRQGLAGATISKDTMKPGCTLIAYLHAKPEKRDELLKVLQSFVNLHARKPACVEYHLHVSNDDPNLFVFYENWRTREELDQHLQMPILTSFWSRRLELLQKDVEIQFITMLSDLD